MSAIARKSSYFFITHLCTFSVPGLYMLLERRGGGVLSVMALWLPAWLSSSVLWSERMESYAFLRTLPVTDRQIVRTKFGLALGFAAVYWLVMSLFIGAAWGSTPEYSTFMALTNLMWAVSIILIGVWYVFSWRFGTTALTWTVIAFMAIVFFATVVVDIDHKLWSRGPGIPPPGWVTEAGWIWQAGWIAVALAAYYGLMRAAVRAKEKSEATL